MEKKKEIWSTHFIYQFCTNQPGYAKRNIVVIDVTLDCSKQKIEVAN